LLDVSSRGNHPTQALPMLEHKDFQIKIAAQIRAALKAEDLHLYNGAVGVITEAE
jgi:hypothetical protein